MYVSVFNAKCLIGRKFNNLKVQQISSALPFKCIDRGGKPHIGVQYRGEEKSGQLPP